MEHFFSYIDMKIERALILQAVDHELDGMSETHTRVNESVVGHLNPKDAKQSILGPQCGTLDKSSSAAAQGRNDVRCLFLS